MERRLKVVFVFSMIILLVFAGVVFATTKDGTKSAKPKPIERRYLRGDEPAAAYTPLSKYPTPSSMAPVVECEDIWPDMQEYPGEYILEHAYIGFTWYDYQKNNSMGRMMSVTGGANPGYRHFSWMYCEDAYAQPGDIRYVEANSRAPGAPPGTFVGMSHVDGGEGASAGYSNQDHLKDGISVVSFHRTAGTPIPNSMLAMEDAVGTGLFTRLWDMPDSIVGGTDVGEWPKLAIKYDEVDGKDYIHYVSTEFNTNPQRLPYIRCYLETPTATTLYCQVPRPGADAELLALEVLPYMIAPGGAVYEFGVSCDVSPIPVCSPVSRKVALTYMPPACGQDCGATLNDVGYCESMQSGNEWMLNGGYPPVTHNVTNYGCVYPSDQAIFDHSACYDYDDKLHIIWSTAQTDEPGYYWPNTSKLWHWSMEANGGIPTMITSNITDPGDDPSPTGFNCNIGKMTISARDPIYDETGKSTASLYAIWTQFDLGDLSDAGYTNGELYGTTSGDGGLTWGNVFNLTNTRTPDCRWDCVGEHWASLATNMYEGNLHIQYVCDKEAGASIQDGTRWMENPLYYYTLKSWDVGERCEGVWTRTDPGSFHRPEIKVPVGGDRTIFLKISNVGNIPMDYTAVAMPSIPGGCITGGPYGGILDILEEVTLSFTISGAGACEGTFIRSSIEVTMCEAAQTVTIPVHAISAADYYECPIDPVTKDTVETSINNLRVYVCANSLEWIDDLDLVDPEAPDIEKVFFQGGPFVATTFDGQYKVVGRFYGDNDFRAGVRDKLYTDFCDYDEFDCYLIYTKNIYMIIPGSLPIHCWWGWWEWSKVIKVCDIPGNRKIVIKYIRVQRHDPPTWWPEVDPFTGYEDTYIGMMMDLDCPGDDNPIVANEGAPNYAGYDDVNHIAWQVGFHDPDAEEPHPDYANYYTGMALANPASITPVAPYAAHSILNDIHLYPQDPWGWLDADLYDIAATSGTSIEDDPEYPGAPRDRSVVMTAKKIDAGTDPLKQESFVVIEAMTPLGFIDLQALIAEGRQIVVDEAAAPPDGHGIPIICGDANGKDGVNMGDAIYLLNYLFKGEAAPLCPMNRADVNSKDGVNMGDAIYLLNYLFKGEAPPNCPGLFF